MTVFAALQQASATIDRRDAFVLLAHVLEQDQAWLLAHGEQELAPSAVHIFLALVARRAAREPLQYLTEVQEFYGLALRVTPAVLIPRPETEHLVEAVLLWATRFHDERTLQIADIGTGSGAIAIALATHLAGAQMTATDLSPEALEVARHNARTHDCEAGIRFVLGDLLDGIAPGARFDAIVSNPPYIAAGDAATLQPEVVRHEPHMALFAGEDGLDLYRRLIPAAEQAVQPGGLLALEIGHGQQPALEALLAGWDDVHFVDDYQGIARVALATRGIR